MTKLLLYNLPVTVGLSISISLLILPLGSTWLVSAQKLTQPPLQQIIYVNTTHPKNNNSLTVTPSSLNNLFKQVENSVVQITSNIPQGEPNALSPQTPNATALGSGFIYDKLGHIVTNAHVVEDANFVDVTFPNGNRYTAKVVGTDPYGDIAVLQISENNTRQLKQISSTLKPLAIGNSSDLEVGDQAIALGNPFGLSDTMTTGIISGIGRLIPATAGGEFSLPDVIQTDAPINPGNSGGPLLNAEGQVIGMNTAGLTETGTFSGIGFAIPSNTISKIVPALISKGYYVHPYIGIKGGPVTADLIANNTGLPANLSGIYVDTITKGGPADKAGLNGSTIDEYSNKHVGDIITAIDGHKVSKVDDLASYIDQHKAVGDNITLTVYRHGHEVNLKAELTARPQLIPLMTISSPPSSVPKPFPHPRPPMVPAP